MAQSHSPIKKTAVFTLAGNITLDSLTHYVHKLSGIRFSFNSSKVRGSKSIHFPANRYKLDALLAQVKRTTSLYYSFYNGYVVFQDNPPLQKPDALPVPPKLKKVQARPLVRKKAISKQPIVASIFGVPKKEIDHTVPGTLVAIIKSPTQKIRVIQPDIISSDSAAYPVVESPINLQDTIEHYRFTFGITKGSDRQRLSFGIIDTTEKYNTPKRDKVKQRQSLRRFGGSATYTGSSIRNNTGLDFDYGLQWKIPLPVQGIKYFFTGANGTKQPYVFLAPGIFIGKTFNSKTRIVVELQALQHYFVKEQLLSVAYEDLPPLNTEKVQRTVYAIKTYGYTIGVQYQHLITNNFFIGGGVSYQAQTKALLHYKKNKVATGEVLLDSTGSVKRKDVDWSGINNAFISISPVIGLQFRKTQIGVQSSFPVFTSLYKNMQVYPASVQLFFRWQWNKERIF